MSVFGESRLLHHANAHTNKNEINTNGNLTKSIIIVLNPPVKLAVRI